MKEYCFKSEKYTVEITEDGQTRRAPVYIALVCDGDGNNKKLPQEVFEVWNGLGMGTNTKKAYFSTFEFSNSAEIKISLPKDTREITAKPDVASLSFADGKAEFKVSENLVYLFKRGECTGIVFEYS